MTRGLVDDLRLVWLARWLVVAVAGGAALATFAWRVSVTPTYEASTTIRISAGPADTDSAERAAFLTGTYLELVPTPGVLGEAIARAGLRIDLDDARRRVSAEPRPTPGFGVIRATGPTATDAQALADATARSLLAVIETEQAEGRGAAAGDGAAVDASIVAVAEAPERPAAPRPGREALAVLVLVAVATAVGAVLLRRGRGGISLGHPGEEVASLLGVPTLVLDGDARSTTRSDDDRARLASFHRRHLDHRPVLTVVDRGVLDLGRGAVMLAEAAARAGRRTLLVDTDVRPASGAGAVSVVTGLGPGPGLTDVLAGDAALDAVAVRLPDLGGVVALRAGVPSGRPAPGPRLSALVANAGAEQAIVSTTAASPLQDTLVVVHTCPDAVVVVVDRLRATRAMVRALDDHVTGAGGRLVAAVVMAGPAPLVALRPGSATRRSGRRSRNGRAAR